MTKAELIVELERGAAALRMFHRAFEETHCNRDRGPDAPEGCLCDDSGEYEQAMLFADAAEAAAVALRERDAAIARVQTERDERLGHALDAVIRVLAMHTDSPLHPGGCKECYRRYPCETVRLLDALPRAELDGEPFAEDTGDRARTDRGHGMGDGA
jgi:hypothetical protein